MSNGCVTGKFQETGVSRAPSSQRIAAVGAKDDADKLT